MLVDQFDADVNEVMAFAAQPPRKRRTLLPAALGVTATAVAAVTTVVVINHRHAPSGPQSVVPITELHAPQDVAVDDTGAVYVTDSGDNRVLKMASGSSKQTEVPFTGLEYSNGLAVDDSGAVYATEGRGLVIKRAAGTREQTLLPFSGLNNPKDVPVDGTGAALGRAVRPAPTTPAGSAGDQRRRAISL
jgi:DNA-binding beta-propeller fold protein YncE